MIGLLAVIYVVFISLGLPDSLFGVVWPVVHKEFSVPESFASVYSVIVAVTSGGVSFFAGRLIRKFGTGRVTFFSVVLTAAGLCGISFAPNIWVMMFFSVIMGYGAGAIDTGLNNYVSLHYEARHMNWLHCFWGIGVSASPIIMSYFLGGTGSGWRGGYRTVAAIQAAIAVVVLISLSRWTKENETEPVQENEPDENKTKISFFKIKGLPTSILTLGIYCSMEFLLGTWGATYIVNSLSLSPDTAAKWIALYYGGIMLGRFLSGFISMKLNDKSMIRLGIIVSAVGMLILALPIGKISLWGLLLIGTGFGPIFPSTLHSVPERFGKKYSADLTGFHMGGAYGIGFAVQLSFGYIAAATSFNITPFVLIGLVIAIFAVNETTLKILKKSKASA